MQKITAYLIFALLSMAIAHEHHGNHHHHHQPQHHHSNHHHNHHPHHKEHHEYPKYEFEYGVHDPHTHDMKKQWEARDGDVVKGSYRLVQPDGRVRVVNYYADDKNGFNAEVKYEGKARHPAVYQHAGHSMHSGSGTGSMGHQHHQHHNHHHTPALVQPHNYEYTIVHTQPKSYVAQGSTLGLGYSMSPAHGLDAAVFGTDTKETHGSSLIYMAKSGDGNSL